MRQAPAFRTCGARLGVGHRPVTALRSSVLCRAMLRSSNTPRLAATRGPSSAACRTSLPGTSTRLALMQQQRGRGSSSVVARSRNNEDSYMFEVEWLGEEVSSGQAEQAMVTRYLQLLRESDIINKLKGRRRFERPRDRKERRFVDRMERIKWERMQPGFVPESLASAGGKDYAAVSEPFMDIFTLRAEWDRVTDYDEPLLAQQQAEAEAGGRYAYTPNGVIDINTLSEDTTYGGYISQAAETAAILQQGAAADSYAAAAVSGGGYVQPSPAGSLTYLNLDELSKFALPTDTDSWISILAQEQQQQQAADQQQQQAYNQEQQQLLLSQLQVQDAAAAAAAYAFGSPAGLPPPPGAAAVPDWSAAAAGYALPDPNPGPASAVSAQQQQQQQQPDMQSFQAVPTWPQQQQQPAGSMELPPLPVDLAAFGWPDMPTAANDFVQPWGQPVQQVLQQQQQPAPQFVQPPVPQLLPQQQQQQEAVDMPAQAVQQVTYEQQALEQTVLSSEQQQASPHPAAASSDGHAELAEVDIAANAAMSTAALVAEPMLTPLPAGAAAAAAAAAAEQPAPDQLVPDQLVPDQLVPDQLVPDQPTAVKAQPAVVAAAEQPAATAPVAMSELTDAAALAEVAAAAAAVADAAAAAASNAVDTGALSPAAAVAVDTAAADTAAAAAQPKAKARRRTRKSSSSAAPTATAADATTAAMPAAVPAAAPAAAAAPKAKKPAAKRGAGRPPAAAAAKEAAPAVASVSSKGASSSSSASDLMQQTQAVLAASRDTARALDELLKAQGRIPSVSSPANGASHANGTVVNGVANGSGKVAGAGNDASSSSKAAAAAEGGSSGSKGKRSQGGAKKRDPVAAR